jgi:formyl-CoA transferase
LQDEHLAATDFFALTEHPSEGKIRSMKVGAQWSDTPAQPERLAPRLSQHGAEILREVGYSTSEIAALLDNQIVGGPAGGSEER